MSIHRWVIASIVGLSLAGAPSAVAETSSPTVEGPIPSDPIGSASHNYPFGSATQNIKAAGYVEQEFFYSGDTPVGDYKTRMIVRRPADPAKFSGTVVVEWQNVTNLYDLEAAWVRSAEHMMRRGDVYVGIDAQTAGVTSPKTGLKAFSPKRYGSLHFPPLAASLGSIQAIAADGGMFDIYGQGIQAVRHPTGVDPLGGLKPKTVLAAGTSQSALYLYLYSQTFDLLHRLTDGFLIAEASTSTLGLNGQTSIALPNVTSRVPVMWINSETDNSYRRLPDSDRFRLWEVAGATHLTRFDRDVQETITVRDFGFLPKPLDCRYTPFSRIPFGYAHNAAYEALKAWVADGRPPRSQPGFDYDAAGTIERDGFDNALGGVRLPQFEVPIATNNRENTGPCKALYGRWVPFTPTTLKVLYPTHAAYVAKVQAATVAAVKSGILVPDDAAETMAVARAAAIPAPACRLRRVAITLPRQVRGHRVLSAQVTVGTGKPRTVRGRDLKVSLTRNARGSVRVKIVLRLRGASHSTILKRYSTCT